VNTSRNVKKIKHKEKRSILK